MNYGEADRILTVFTERLGKVKVLAKGVRKISSKLAGSLEPFNILELELHAGKTFYAITSAVIAECFDCDRHLSFSNQAVYLAEIVDKVFEEEEKNHRAFELFVQSLRQLNSSPERVAAVDSRQAFNNNLAIRLFELKILYEAGFQPDLFHCSKCKKDLTAGGNYISRNGNLQCRECAEVTAENMPDNVIKLLRLMQSSDPDIASRIKCSDSEQKVAEKYLDQLLQNALERELKSKKYL